MDISKNQWRSTGGIIGIKMLWVGQLRIKSNNFKFDESKKLNVLALLFYLDFFYKSEDQSSVGVFEPIIVANIMKKLHLLANARDDIVRACVGFWFFLKVDFCF